MCSDLGSDDLELAKEEAQDPQPQPQPAVITSVMKGQV